MRPLTPAQIEVIMNPPVNDARPVRYRPLWSAASLGMDAPSWGRWHDVTFRACGYIAPVWVRQLNDGTAEAYELELANGQRVTVRKLDDSLEAMGRRADRIYRAFKAEQQDLDASAPGYTPGLSVRDFGWIKPGQYEGETCHRDGCVGRMVLEPVENCRCHISPPCHYCMANLPVCDTCGAETDVKS